SPPSRLPSSHPRQPTPPSPPAPSHRPPTPPLPASHPPPPPRSAHRESPRSLSATPSLAPSPPAPREWQTHAAASPRRGTWRSRRKPGQSKEWQGNGATWHSHKDARVTGNSRGNQHTRRATEN